MKSISQQNGFTLIELLVVVAIIGILAAIVLGSLSDTRRSAKDAVIKESISEAIKDAALFADANGDWDGFCDDPELVGSGKLADQVVRSGGTFQCGSTAEGFCVSATLNMGVNICSDEYRAIKEGFLCTAADDIVCD